MEDILQNLTQLRANSLATFLTALQWTEHQKLFFQVSLQFRFCTLSTLNQTKALVFNIESKENMKQIYDFSGKHDHNYVCFVCVSGIRNSVRNLASWLQMDVEQTSCQPSSQQTWRIFETSWASLVSFIKRKSLYSISEDPSSTNILKFSSF